MSDLAAIMARLDREDAHPGAVGRYELVRDGRALLVLLRETREALAAYGGHRSDCLVWRAPSCSCGFTVALAALTEPTT